MATVQSKLFGQPFADDKTVFGQGNCWGNNVGQCKGAIFFMGIDQACH